MKARNQSATPNPGINKFDSGKLIAEISARMMCAPVETFDEEIQCALKNYLEPLGVDRGGLLEVVEGSQVLKVSYIWFAEGTDPVSGELNLAELFPWSYHQLIVLGKDVISARIEDMPPEAHVDRQTHLHFGTKSAVSLPIFVGQRVHHLISINALEVERDWSEEMIEQLRLLGEIFVSAMQRREAELALRAAKDRLDLAAASAGAGLWEIDIASGILWITDQTREMFGFDADLELTIERFLSEVHGDDRALVVAAIEEACSVDKEASIEYRVVSADGRVRWMNSRGRLQSGKTDRRPRLMGVTLDVTGRKQLELQLQEQIQENKRLRSQLEEENTFLRNEAARVDVLPHFSGSSQCMQAVMAQVEQVAPTGSTVLILGETGTGKELVAQTIHRLSERGRQAMVKVNCAALPAALVESELFGREKGAFTGALSRQVGRFELANGSTLFLDEIAEMPMETQAKLLRVLQEGEFERLGSPRTIKVDVRIIAATNRDLDEEVRQGRFRRDLYYRLNIFPIHLPPLRDRPEDIPQIAWEFVNEFGERMGKKIRRIANRDMEWLKSRSWPGNIRELRNVIEHALIVSKGETLELQQSSAEKQKSLSAVTLEDIERQHIQMILDATHGRVKGPDGASARLGLNPSTLYSRMRKLGMRKTQS